MHCKIMAIYIFAVLRNSSNRTLPLPAVSVLGTKAISVIMKMAALSSER